ncbi:citrate transporter [Candidatus Gracilibacteria bacterium]|nr:MAG: citrate transporter [Candidatus Gracilibacteria bacterium]
MKKILSLFLASGGSLLLPSLSYASSHVSEHSEAVFDPSRGIFMAIIMIIVVGLIASELIHRTLIVFFVASALILLSYTLGHFFPWWDFLTLDKAFVAIDGQVIALLIAMMIIVGVMAQTNVFQWMAVKIFEFSKGRFIPLYFVFFFITAIFSAFLDNVTMMFLVTPVAISIAKIFEVSPVKFIIALIIASNLGGTATLIGDPPNIMIGSYAHLSFNAFIVNLGIPVFFMLFIISTGAYMILKGEFAKARKIDDLESVIQTLKTENPIYHPRLLVASLITLAFVIIGFFSHSFFHMPAAVPALTGAGLLMLMRDYLMRSKFHGEGLPKEKVEQQIHNTFSKDVEWLVIAFFVFLFMIVGALEHTGILEVVATFIQTTFGNNLLLCALAILWVSALFSMLLDNIPFTAVMLPVVASLVANYSSMGLDANFLWWALAFGACLGGNGTLIGASANLVGAALLEKQKYHLSFGEYFKTGFPLTIAQISMASVAIYIMYLMSV